MLSLLELADILDFIYCNYIGIEKIKIETFKDHNIAIDSFLFSRILSRQNQKKSFKCF